MTSSDGARPLTGKVALVTGAGRGLGRAFAERLASLGADIAIHGMRENGPAEYGEGTTLTAVAEAVAARSRRTHHPRARRPDQGRRHRPHRRDNVALARADRYPRPQCRRRHRRGRRQARSERRRRHSRGGRARGAGPQPARNHPDLSGGGARHDGTALRPHRHHRLGRRLQGPHPGLDLCRRQGRG